MKLRNFTLRGLAVLWMLSSAAQAASITYYQDQGDFSDSGLTFTEDFNDGSLDAPIFATNALNATVSDGRWNDQVSDRSTTFSFAGGIFGFGAAWDLLGPSGPGSGITLTVGRADGSTQVLENEVSRFLSGDFFGFVTDVAFDSLTLSLGTQRPGIIETFALDDLSVLISADAAPAPVPLPASGLLFLAGLVGIAGALRKRG